MIKTLSLLRFDKTKPREFEKKDIQKLKTSKITPTIGILANFKSEQSKPLGKQTNLIKDFLLAAKDAGIEIGIFHPRELIESKEPTGHFGGTDIWKKKTFPFPSALIDRFYSSLEGFDKNIQKQKLHIEKNIGTPFLNPLKFADVVTDKKHFSINMKISNIPTPQILQSPIDDIDKLWENINLYQDVILKPRFGRMGKCVFRISKENNTLTFLFEKKHILFRTKWQLHGILHQFCAMNNIYLQHLILQKTIKINKLAGRFFDIRILVQRADGATNPTITGEVVRISPDQGSVPNIDQGGVVMPLEMCLTKTFPNSWQTLSQKMRQMAFDTYEFMESQFGLIGEAGIDFLVDKDEQIWVVEINSKPGRIAFERLASGFGLTSTQKEQFAQQRKISILNPVKYAYWLANQKAAQ